MTQYQWMPLQAIKTNKEVPGSISYKEIVNFGEVIGYAIDKETGAQTATTWGKIHYGKKGLHIVPVNPR